MKLATLVVALSYAPANIRTNQPIAALIGCAGLVLLVALLCVAYGGGARHEHEDEQNRRNR